MRWKCRVAYDGTGYEGWQSQPSGNTIQDFIERRLAVLFERRIVLHGSGRTDGGVHARGQVFHFDGAWRDGPEALLRALRTGYPDSIQVMDAKVVDDHFHARYSATGKRYSYHFFEGYADPFSTRYHWSTGNRYLDVDQMNLAAGFLVGRHDFSSFSANPGDNREKQPVKDLRRLVVDREGPRIRLVAEADGFLFRMVRSLAGCLFDVGSGKLDPSEVVKIRDMRRRSNLVRTAPPQGLFLDEVWYE